MKKKILIGSILAVALLTLVSFSSVVGYSSVKSDLDISVEENAIPLEVKLQRIKDLVHSIDLWKIIVNPDSVVDTLEEVSSILEEEDVRNYIEKTSEDDCGCYGDSSYLEGDNSVICTLLLIPMTLSLGLVLLFNFAAFPIAGFFLFLGMIFNCSWA